MTLGNLAKGDLKKLSFTQLADSVTVKPKAELLQAEWEKPERNYIIYGTKRAESDDGGRSPSVLQGCL